MSFSDTFDNPEAKAFFQGHYSEVFYVFYDVFSSIESNAKQKGRSLEILNFAAVIYLVSASLCSV